MMYEKVIQEMMDRLDTIKKHSENQTRKNYIEDIQFLLTNLLLDYQEDKTGKW